MRFLLLFTLIFWSVNSLGTTFDPFQKILNKHLSVKELNGGGLETSFDYEGAKKNPETEKLRKNQVTELQNFKVDSLDSKNEALAFWINAYNFFMINIILTEGFDGNKLNIDSVKDFGSFFNPYKVFKKEINKVGGKNYSLDQIEKETLLGTEYREKGWKDARVHFAVNCASVGCPPLIKEVYKAKTLDKTLDENLEKAMHTPRHLEVKGKELHLTHLFKWYRDDFKEASGSVRKFIYKAIKNKNLLKAVKSTNDIDYIDYDWKLNRSENF